MKKNNQTDNKIAPIGQPDITEHNKASNLLPDVLKSLSDINRVILAAPKSGSGKTLITCAIMSALKKRGLKVKGFKCGPDYIDPMFHRKALGIETGNIDSFFTPGDGVRRILEDGSKGYDISVIEGVMGYYDGLGGVSDSASTYEISRETSTPVILVVDAKGAGVSLAATIKGIIDYRTDSNIKGIILNKITPSYYEKIKKLIEEETGVLVLGFMPYDATLTVPDRHLGLVAPEELSDVTKWLEIIADYANTYIDLNALIELAKTPAQEVQTTAETEPTAETPIAEINTSYNTQSGKVRIAVARDEAFSFYYIENIRILEKFGAEIIYFSPLHDEKLPADIDCIILWGGYPELYAKDLSANRTMRESIKKAYEKGKLLVAECGGFMYINKSLEDNAGNEHEMVGILDGKCYKTDKLCRFGYVTLDNTIRCHEFHRWDCTDNGEYFSAEKTDGTTYRCMHVNNHLIAGFPHIYYESNPEIAKRIIEKCYDIRLAGKAKKKWDMIAKPIDSLGMFEEQVAKICTIKRDINYKGPEKRALAVFCADHGVVAEGVTQTTQEVTKIVSENFARNASTVNHMAGYVNADVFVFDVGINCKNYEDKNISQGHVIDRKIKKGTGNIAKECAMTVEECQAAIDVGIEAVEYLTREGYEIIATGEMGIGNTTPTSALASILLRIDANDVTGRGAGLSDEALETKKQIVGQIVQRTLNELNDTSTKAMTKTTRENAFEILRQAGGLEIAAMAGVFLGGVRYRVPIIVDGAISAVSALVAFYMDNRVADFAIASHQSEEITEKMSLDKMGLKAPVTAGMKLGEGTGAMTLIPLIDMAFQVYEKMGTFSQNEIEAYERYE